VGTYSRGILKESRGFLKRGGGRDEFRYLDIDDQAAGHGECHLDDYPWTYDNEHCGVDISHSACPQDF
jgi:hypothetical protein